MKWFVRLLKVAYIALIAALPVAAMADYLATAGSGLTFGSIDLAGIKFPAFIGCDPTTAKQCWAINTSGQVAIQAPPTLPLPTGAATSALQTTGNTSLTTINTTLGTPMQASGGSVTANAGTNLNTSALSTSANQTSELTKLDTIITNTGAAIPAGTNAIGNLASQYPGGAVPITASATGTTTATTATLAASASIKTYICGMSIRANATGAATNNATITGTVTGTLNFTQWTAPLASGLGVTEQIFNPCVPSSAINTGIAVISGAPGSGGVVSVSAWGYQL